MFEYDVTKHKLIDEIKKCSYCNHRRWMCPTDCGIKVFDFEKDVSREDKIDFIDKKNGTRLKDIITLLDKYYEENTDTSGLRTNELDAKNSLWLKENDVDGLLNDSGWFRIFGLCVQEFGNDVDNIGCYGFGYGYKNLVNKLFHYQMVICLREEREWMEENDEYTILKRKFLERGHSTLFGVNLSYAKKEIYIKGVGENRDKKRLITLEELRTLIRGYDLLDKYEEEIEKNIHIEF